MYNIRGLIITVIPDFYKSSFKSLYLLLNQSILSIIAADNNTHYKNIYNILILSFKFSIYI